MVHDHASSTPGLWAVWLLITFVLLRYIGAACHRPGWSRWRTASFATGGLLLLAAFSSPMVAWAHAELRGHMAQHLLLGMIGPFFLVMGAPVTLLLGAVSTATARRCVRLLGTLPIRVVSHPVAALVLNTGGMLLLYSTPLYAASKDHLWLHALVHCHFLAAGYLFAWSIAGPDPAPHRPSVRVRAVVLLVSIAVHSTLGKLMYAHAWPAATGATETEIQAAAQWMYYGGDLAEMLVGAALASIWLSQSRGVANADVAPRHSSVAR